VQRLLRVARGRVGIRQGEIDRRRLQAYAAPALPAWQQMRRSQRELARWVRGRPVLEAQARVVGSATACVWWAHVGDPRA
jgi:hypothetical protein